MKRHDFTLTELLVVIAIIAVLAGLTVPAVGMAQEKAKGTACLSNQKQCVTAYTMYSHEYKGWGPAAYSKGGESWAKILKKKKFLDSREVMSCPKVTDVLVKDNEITRLRDEDTIPKKDESRKFVSVYGMPDAYGKFSSDYIAEKDKLGKSADHMFEIAVEKLITSRKLKHPTTDETVIVPPSKLDFLTCSLNAQAWKGHGFVAGNPWTLTEGNYLVAAAHSGSTINVGFLDGHADIVNVQHFRILGKGHVEDQPVFLGVKDYFDLNGGRVARIK